ncbi:hypothetical protein HYPSUDRAFT_64036 [Hypholoma sublateritium FD-334 SS-4]|uniref:G-protein coupled receptors family 1 profile domain-containing protein n=1 Tax=Hypholoma sublateritium (strain FD-334 SS-4) TaxID=945553 RepID=A0A0D2LFC4_HYPSF|nr:hypothetical protein HYPSUDRAFT_64036 [Hypholoma sublateritium FD-334 SS-4]
MSNFEFRQSRDDSWDYSRTHPRKVLIIIFDILYIVGPVSLLIILLTAWRSRDVRRRPTWFMAVGSWVVISVANTLLIGHQTGLAEHIPHGICLVQSILIYTSPVFCAFSAVSFLLQTYLAMSIYTLPNISGVNTNIVVLYVVPCAISLSIVVEGLILGVSKPLYVERDASGLYCNFSISTPRKITGGSIMCGLLIVLLIEALMIVAFRQRAQNVAKLDKLEYAENRQAVYVDDLARVGAFTTCALVSFSVSLVQYMPKYMIDNGVVSVVQATLPCCAGLIFGSQKDILRAWLPRRSDETKAHFTQIP